MQQVKLFSTVVGLCVVLGLVLSSNSGASYFQGFGSDPDGFIVAKDLSYDGSVVVGSVSAANGGAFRWTKEDGMVNLPTEPIEPNSPYSGYSASCVSPDGTIIIANYDRYWFDEAFRWTEESGMVSLFDFGSKLGNFLTAASADGYTVIGFYNNFMFPTAFRWSQDTGEVENFDYGEMADDISDDGSIVVGYKVSDPFEGSDGDYEACIWTPEGGMTPIGLGCLPGGTNSYASAVSGDGSVVVGRSSGKAFRWTEDTGMVSLGVSPDASFSRAEDVSADGEIIAGNLIDPDGVFIWDATNEMRNLNDLLTNTYHLNLTGWKLTSATAISGDGKTIIGEGTNPDGNEESWIANIDACSGSLEVGIEPDEAVSAGAKWRVDEGVWLNADQVHSCLSAGSHTIEFQTVSGWTTPESQTVEVLEGKQTSISGQYIEVENSSGQHIEADNDDGSGGCFIGTMSAY